MCPMTHKKVKLGIILLILLDGIFLEQIEARQSQRQKIQKAFVFTTSDTYLAPQNGEIIAELRSILPARRVGKSSVLLFGKFKKFGSFPQEVIQVVWFEVGIETKRSLKKGILSEKIRSSFRFGNSLLPKRTKLKIKGNLTGLLSKVQFLLKEDAAHSDEETFSEKRRGSLSENDQDKVLKKRSSGEAEKSSSGDQERIKDQKRESYRANMRKAVNPFLLSSRIREGQMFQPLIPEKKEAKTQEEKQEKLPIADSMEIEILKEGCAPRIDDSQGMVIIQTRSNILKNGLIVKREICSDSSERYQIKKRYDGCLDKISKDQGFAWAQYKRYWTDGVGSVHEIDRECQVDEDMFFEILEQEKACALSIDLKELTAQRMAELYYKDRKKCHITLEECRPLKGAAPLKLEKIFCGYNHDFERKLSFPQTRIIALLEGKEIRITPCVDDGDGIIHEISHGGCDPIIDRESGRRFAQVRTIIETKQGPKSITGCRPSQELQETHIGCETKFDHDLEIGKSRGYTRFFHTIRDIKTYVTDCMPSDVTFPHQIRIKGWDHFDDLKASKPRTEIYIEVPYAGSILVDAARLRSNAESVPYQPKAIHQKKDEQKAKFEGCFKITPLKRIQVYERPDHSQYEVFIGEDRPERSQNLCKISEETQEYKSSSWVWSLHGRPFTDAWRSGGSMVGWVSCEVVSGRINMSRGDGWSFFLYYHSQLQKRTKTDFPSGQIEYTPWQIFGPSQKVREQTCHYG